MTIRVNGEIVPEEAIRIELRRLLRFYAEHMPGADVSGMSESLLRRAKEQAVGEKLLINEGARLKPEVSEDDIDRKLKGVVAQCGGEAAFQATLLKQGMAASAVRDVVVSGLRVEKLVSQATAGVPEPTDIEARHYYDRHPGEFRTAERARARHILIQPESDSGEDRAIAKAKLLGVRKQLEEGAEFADLASKHSECSSGRSAGGGLGWISRGTTVPEFDNAVFAMNIGETSDVVETPLGYHIIQKLDGEAAREASFDEVQGRILDLIRHSRRGKAVADYVAKLRFQSVIEDDGDDIVEDFVRELQSSQDSSPESEPDSGDES